MRLRVRLRTLMFVTLLLALVLAVVAPDYYEAQRRASGCYVLGDVVFPGRIETLGLKLTVKDAIKAARGLSPNADPGKIRLVRPSSSGEQVLSIDLRKPGTNYVLKPGDRLIIHRARYSN
jgi:protein involved in polysaccharide export with SLBB domain